MSQEKLHVDAVVFDLDGTLIESVHVHFKALNIAFAHLGLPPVSWEEMIEATREGRFDWDRVLPGDDKDLQDEIMVKCFKIIRSIQPEMLRKEVRVIRGVDRVLRDLSEAGMRIALVTSTLRTFLPDKLHLLDKAGVARLFEVIIAADDVAERKPAPAPLSECGKRMDLSPERIVYVGDSRVDIRTGKAAGTKTVGVLTGLDDYEALSAENPDWILESVRDLGINGIIP